MHVWRLICSFVTYVHGHSASKFIWFFLCTCLYVMQTRSLNQRFWWAMQTSSEAMDPHNTRRAVATHSRCPTSGRRTLTLGVVGAGLIYVHVYLTSIYLLKLYKIKAMIPVSTSFTTLLLYINWEGLTSPSIATPPPPPGSDASNKRECFFKNRNISRQIWFLSSFSCKNQSNKESKQPINEFDTS